MATVLQYMELTREASTEHMVTEKEELLITKKL